MNIIEVSFREELINKIISGLKTQTRRPVGEMSLSSKKSKWWGIKTGDILSVRGSSVKLRVTRKRIDHLQDITEDQAKDEGVEPELAYFSGDEITSGSANYINGFFCLWQEIYGSNDQLHWSQNPKVFVVEFELLSAEPNQLDIIELEDYHE